MKRLSIIAIPGAVLVAALWYFVHEVSRHPVITIYVSNRSFDLASIDMTIKLDTTVVADTLFIEHEEPMVGEKYEVDLEEGEHIIDVSSASMNLNEVVKFDAENDTYVIVDFIYKQRGTHRYDSARRQFDRLTRRDPDAMIRSDTMQIAPTIRIRVSNEKPDFLTE